MLNHNFLKDIFKQLLANKRQSFLTLIAVAIAVFVVLLILSSSAYTTKQLAADLEIDDGETYTLTYQPNESQSLFGFSQADYELLEQYLGKNKVKKNTTSYSLMTTATYHDRSESLTFRAIEDLANHVVLPTSLVGKELKELSDNEIAISDDTAKQLSRQENPSQLLDQVLAIKGQNYRIAAVFYASSLRDFLPQMIATTKTKQNLLDNKDYTQQLIVKTRDSHSLHKMLELLDTQGSYRNEGSYHYIDNVKLYEDSKAQVQVVLTLIALLSGVSIFVSGFGVMNAMLSSVSERSREIAIRRSLGAKQKDIQIAYLIEGSLLAFLGGCLGLGASLLFTFIMTAIGLTAQISLTQIAITLGVALSCGALFSYIPALVASHKNVIDGLKS